MSEAGTSEAVKVLFVDDEQAFLDMMCEVLPELSEGTWSLATATRCDEAMQRLREDGFDLAVFDVNMPDQSGLDLLQAVNQEFPGLPKVFLTNAAEPDTRLEGLEGGADMFLEKPEGLDGIRSVFATLNELVRWQRKQEARGMTQRFGLKEIVKFECLTGSSRLIEVQSGDEKGVIHIQEGQVIHSRADFRTGQTAFCWLLCLKDPEYLLKPFTPPKEPNIDRQWEFLLLEATQMIQQQEESAVDQRPSRRAPSPPETESPERPKEAARPATPGPQPKPAEETEEPPASSVPVSLDFSPTNEELVNMSYDTEFTLAPTAERKVEIEEFLMATTEKEVLHEWRVHGLEERLNFLSRLAGLSRAMTEGLPLGDCERIEMTAIQSRLVVQFTKDRMVLIRSTQGCRDPRPAILTEGMTLNEWLEAVVPVRGLHALGLLQPDAVPLSHSMSKDFPQELLGQTWSSTEKTFQLARNNRFPAWQIRWVFERAQVYCYKRKDERMLGAIVERQEQKLDIAAAEQCFRDFRKLRAA